MSTEFHDGYVLGVTEWKSAQLNAPLEQLDEAIGGVRDTVTVLTAAFESVSVNVKTANTIYAGPSSGDPAVPSFRSLTVDDLPDHDHAIEEVDLPEHNHDDRYYTETELASVSSGAVVDFSNLANVPDYGSGDGNIVGPDSSTDSYVPQYDGVTGQLLKEGFPITEAGKNLLDDTTIVAQRETLDVNSVFLGLTFEVLDKPPADAEYSILIPISLTIPANLAGSLYFASTGPTSEAVVSVKKNGTEFATMTVAIGATSAVTLSGTETSFVAGDRLSFAFPTTQDSTWAGVSITAKGVKG